MYLGRHCQILSISNTHSVSQILFSGVPQGSILASRSLNICLNGLYLWISETDLLGFAVDGTISTFRKYDAKIYRVRGRKLAIIEGFKINEIIVYVDQFQAIAIKRTILIL